MTFDELMLQESMMINEEPWYAGKKIGRKLLAGAAMAGAVAGGIKGAQKAGEAIEASSIKKAEAKMSSGNATEYKKYNSEKIGNEDTDDVILKMKIFDKIVNKCKATGMSSYDLCKELVDRNGADPEIADGVYFHRISKKGDGYELNYEYTDTSSAAPDKSIRVKERITIPNIPGKGYHFKY